MCTICTAIILLLEVIDALGDRSAGFQASLQPFRASRGESGWQSQLAELIRFLVNELRSFIIGELRCVIARC